MAKQAIRPLVDRLMQGNLYPWLLARRAEGLSYNDIAADLEAEIGHRVTGETIRTWLAPAEASA